MIKKLTADGNITIKNAMKQLDLTAEKILLIVDEDNRLIGALTDGDVRRAMLAGKGIGESINGIFNSNPIFLYNDSVTDKAVSKILTEKRIELIPIVDREMHVVDYITWDSLFKDGNEKHLREVDRIEIPVVIMAGGKGTRMEPFTKVLPKPLIPIGEKTIAELIIEQFTHFGVKNFYFILNYKGDMIKAYFNSIEHDYSITYIEEDDFYGTAGSLRLLENIITDKFILSNCDVLVRANYSEVLKFHESNNSELTVLSSIQHYQIPYGVIEFGKNGAVYEIREKPEQTLTINTGMYVINYGCLELIPPAEVFHMTDLLEKLIKRERSVFTFPVNTADYIDIGQWEEYKKAVGKLLV